jgi:folate-binding protein YgfZ
MDEATPAATMLADRALLRLSGPDVRGFLQGLVTNDVAGALPVWTGLLTPQGKVMFDMLLWADGDDILVDAEAGRIEALQRRLSLYRLRRPITIATEPALAVHWSRDRPSHSGAVPDPRLAALGWRWLAPPSTPATGWLAHRLAHGVVEGAAELGDGQILWLECNAAELRGVSFTKGCYVGQENTARMHYRAKVNRRLVVAPDQPEDRATAHYPELGLMVVHRRVEALGDAVMPHWLSDVLASAPQPVGEDAELSPST